MSGAEKVKLGTNPPIGCMARSHCHSGRISHLATGSRLLLLIALTIAGLATTVPAIAQRSEARSTMTFVKAERQSIELRQGMTSEDVERLLGKPKRTALKQGFAASADAAQGSLQWTYMWADTSQRDDTLQVVFTRKSGQWLVESWGWNAYF